MAFDDVVIDGRDLMKEVRLTVRFPRALPIRFWLASKLIWMAGIVSGVTAEVDVDSRDD